MHTCFLIGHRTVPEFIRAKLHDEVAHYAKSHSKCRFIVGNHGTFDAMATDAVIHIKKLFPTVTLYLLLPYHSAERKISVPTGFDGTIFPFEKPAPRRFAIAKANQLMIDNCDCLIAYASHPGNARNFLEYAQKVAKRREMTIINLAQR